MTVRRALDSDREKVLDFCKNTFSWGDYIARIWEHWIREDDMLVIGQEGAPVAICHTSQMGDSSAWIEGIRVHPKYRHLGHATRLIRHCEKLALEKNRRRIRMLIETNNSKSIRLARDAGYSARETWGFYTLKGLVEKKGFRTDHAVTEGRRRRLLASEHIYVDSWRMYELTAGRMDHLAGEGRMVFSGSHDAGGAAILVESRHFEKTLIVTLLFGDSTGTSNILSHIARLSREKNYKHVQILTRLDLTPLEQKLSFHLVEKNF